MTKEHQTFLCLLAKKYEKKSFSIEEAKKYLTEEERFTEKDFSYYWKKSFLPLDEDNTFIKRDGSNFILTYKSLTLIPKNDKIPWTHAEIISIISVITSSITTLTVAILGVLI